MVRTSLTIQMRVEGIRSLRRYLGHLKKYLLNLASAKEPRLNKNSWRNVNKTCHEDVSISCVGSARRLRQNQLSRVRLMRLNRSLVSWTGRLANGHG